ncbi:MAG: hypothetical protein U0841_24975 [Chloroflexia bacterium]
MVRLDGRDVELPPAGFLRAFRRALGLDEGTAADALPVWPGDGVLLVDTYETLADLDPGCARRRCSWLRAAWWSWPGATSRHRPGAPISTGPI